MLQFWMFPLISAFSTTFKKKMLTTANDTLLGRRGSGDDNWRFGCWFNAGHQDKYEQIFYFFHVDVKDKINGLYGYFSGG